MVEVSDKLLEELSDIRNADTTKLAYIGDAVYELFVRQRSVEACGRHAGDMNKFTVHYVRAESQAKAARGLLRGNDAGASDTAVGADECRSAESRADTAVGAGEFRSAESRADGFDDAISGKMFYTADEAALFKRARNRTNTSHPRGCTPAEYKLATGFEAVIGWLYIKGDGSRLAEIINEALLIIGE
ncbi:MAG: hypothetical protein IJH41_06540 [Eubacterium sp.]|nr:hypothetical protein [Eubacterium sp.]